MVLPGEINAQRSLGVQWSVPESEREALQELAELDQLGISYIEVRSLLSDKLLRRTRQYGLDLYVTIPIRFPTGISLIRNDSVYASIIEKFFRNYGGASNVQAFGALEYGQTHRKEFAERFAPFTRYIQQITDKPIYYKTAVNRREPIADQFNFRLFSVSDFPFDGWRDYHGFIFAVSSPGSFETFQHLLEQTDSLSKPPLIFIDSSWLLDRVRKYPEFRSFVSSVTSDSLAIYPKSLESRSSKEEANWIVLIFIAILTAYIFLFKSQPTYRKNLTRYFLAHSFFVKDIIEWRNRMPTTGFLLLLIHSFIGGAWIYALLKFFHSPLSMDVLHYHLPALQFLGEWPIFYFFVGTICTFLIQLLFVLWLYIPAVSLQHFGQPLVLFAWPLQLNFVLLIIFIPLTLTDTSVSALLLFTLFFLLIFICSYYLTAFDIFHNVRRGKILFIFISVALHMAILIGVASLLNQSAGLSGALDLIVAFR